MADLAELPAHRLVIEQDDSLLRSDQETLYRAVRANGVEGQLVSAHLSPRLEPLLWIPDAVAWCWDKGGVWKDRVLPLVDEVGTLWTARGPAHQPSGWLPGSLRRRYRTVRVKGSSPPR